MDDNNIFLSYSRRNVEFVKQLDVALREMGRSIWVDWEDIPPGAISFSDEIRRGIESAEVIIAVLSPEYLDSPYCVAELNYAASIFKKIIPIVYIKFDGRQPPTSIEEINWVYFCPHAGQVNDFDSAFDRLISAIDTDHDYVREHNRFFVRARDWERSGKSPSQLLRGDNLAEAQNWLETSSTKEPEPTQLHRDFIRISRDSERRRQRIQLTAVTGALAIMTLLALLAFVLRQQSEERSILAQNNAATATVAQGQALANANSAATSESEAIANEARAVTNEAIANANANQAATNAAEAIANANIAATNEAEAIANANESESRRLADLASSVLNDNQGNFEAATLLAIQALNTAYSEQADAVLLHVLDNLLQSTSALPERKIDFLDAITEVAVSPDNHYLLAGVDPTNSGGWRNTVWLSDLATGETVGQFGEDLRASSVAFSPDGQVVLTGSTDGKVRLWSINKYDQPIHEFMAHEGAVNSADFSPDGKYVLTGGLDESLIEPQTLPVATIEFLHSISFPQQKVIARLSTG